MDFCRAALKSAQYEVTRKKNHDLVRMAIGYQQVLIHFLNQVKDEMPVRCLKQVICEMPVGSVGCLPVCIPPYRQSQARPTPRPDTFLCPHPHPPHVSSTWTPKIKEPLARSQEPTETSNNVLSSNGDRSNAVFKAHVFRRLETTSCAKAQPLDHVLIRTLRIASKSTPHPTEPARDRTPSHTASRKS